MRFCNRYAVLTACASHSIIKEIRSEAIPVSINGRYADITQRLCTCAAKDENIRAVIAIGSLARQQTPADEFSDLDLIIVTKEVQRWTLGEYSMLLGEVSISFKEPTLGGGTERRCIYEGGRDVDMIIFTPEQFRKALKNGEAGWVMNRGYKLLYDTDGLSELIPKYVTLGISPPEMTGEEFDNLVSDFYFHNIWASKKLRRGELWAAKMCIDAYLKVRLLRVIEQYQLCLGETDVWHDGRFLDSWAERDVLGELEGCFAHYDADDCERALLATHRLFARLSRAVAKKKGFFYDKEAEKCAQSFIGA